MKVKGITKKNGIIAAALVMMLAIGTAIAYFTDMGSVTNSFTVGNIDIELEEPNWDPDAAKDITPMMEIAKDPQIENIGANPAYVFAVVTIPRANVETAAADGSHVAAQIQDLFTYSVNSGWKEVKKETTDGSTIYTYGYVGSDGNMKPLEKAATTTPVFEKVQLINLVEGTLADTDIEIKVDVKAIQSDDIGTNNPEEGLKMIDNANK